MSIFIPSDWAFVLPWRESHPSCCHVNHRPTGSRLFTLVSLPPRFDYCNCLLTMCSAGFHTSTSCQGRELWAAWVTVKGDASNVYTNPASVPVHSSSLSLCSVCVHACKLSCSIMFDSLQLHWSPPGSSVHGISQARILEWVAISYSKGSFRPRDRISISCVSCIARQIFYLCATWEALCSLY